MEFSAKDARRISASAIEEARRKREKEHKEKEVENERKVRLAWKRYEEHEAYIENNAGEIMQFIIQEAKASLLKSIERYARAGHTSCWLSLSYGGSTTRHFLRTKYPELTDDDIDHILFYIKEGCRCKECIPCRIYGPTPRFWVLKFVWILGYKGNPFWSQVVSFLKSKDYKVRYKTRSETKAHTVNAGCGSTATRYATTYYDGISVSWD